MMTNAQHARALADLEVALALIPPLEKEDYLQAIYRCPELFATESDPMRFLRFTNYNATAAARSLIRYWKGRKEVLGEKAFLPFTFNAGEGALDEDTIAIVRSGVSFTPLNDEFGRTLLFMDTGRKLTTNPEPVKNYLFFLYQYIMENDLSQTDGYVLVILMGESFRLQRISYDTVRVCINTFPIKVKAWHFVSRDLRFSRSRMFEFVMKAYSKLFKGHDVFFHTCEQGATIAKSLESHGIHRSTIPMYMGGEWSYWSVHEWIATRKYHNNPIAAVQNTFINSTQDLSNTEISPNRSCLPLKKRKKRLATENSSFGCKDQGPKEQMTECSTLPLKPSQETAGISLLQEQAIRMAFDLWQGPCTHAKEEYNKTLFGMDVKHFICKYMGKELQSLPEGDTKNFLTASTIATNATWEDESNPFLFVLSEDFNIVSAARRLVQYWNLRCDVFGDRAWKAMNQTGEGALIRQPDLSVLDTEFVTLLPHDNTDCSVIFVSAKWFEFHLSECRKRCLFYIFSVATENRNSQRAGIVVIFNIVDCSREFFQDIVSFFHKLISCLPLRVKAIHVLTTEANVSHSNDTFSKLDHTVYIHTSQNMTAMASTLTKFDLTMDGLPRCVGGDWGTSHFNMWQELRCRIEWNIPLGIGANIYENLPAVRKVYFVIEDKRERGRRMNAIHSWRKRARFRIERADLEEKCADLISEQKRLRSTNGALESLLQSARDCVPHPHAGFEG